MQRRRFWLAAAGVAALALASAAAFSAYLRPDMLAAFGEAWAFCVSLLR